MKKLFLAFVVALFMNSAFAANETPIDKSGKYTETLRELSSLLNDSSIFGKFTEEAVVRVKVMINESHEIVVLDTSTTDETLSSHIKNSLNYQKITANELEIGKELIFKIRFINY